MAESASTADPQASSAPAAPVPSQPSTAEQDDPTALDAAIEADIEMPDQSSSQQQQPRPQQEGPDGMNLDGASGEPAGQSGDGIAVPDVRVPTKKDASLRDFLGKMDDYAPIIPDAVTNYYLTLAGLPPPPATPLPLARLLALATQKFIADIAADAYQYSRIRSANTTAGNNPLGGLGAGPGGAGGGGASGSGGGGGGGGAQGAGSKDDAKGKAINLGVQRPGFGGGGQGGGQGKTVLTMEDLGMAVAEYGVNVKRGEFYR